MFTDIPPDSVETSVVQRQITETLADESLYFSGEVASDSQMILKRSWIPLLNCLEYLDVPYADPVVRKKDYGDAAGADHWAYRGDSSDPVSRSYQTRDSVIDSRDDPTDDSSPTKLLEIDMWINWYVFVDSDTRYS